jgi:DNA mismatch repair protein MutL
MDGGDVGPAIEEICEKLRKNRGIDPRGARDEILHTVACKAAIKAGWKTDPRELDALAEAVVSGRVKYCPHGRPVAVTLTKKELDKQFKRIV